MNYVVTVGAVTLLALARSMMAQEAAATVPVTAGEGALVFDAQGTPGDSAKRVAVTVLPNGAAPNVSGTADVVGFPFIQSGSGNDIDWKVDGSAVTGSITGADGRVVGTFVGAITATGMNGLFTHVDGRVGQWSWDGPLPQ